MQQNKQYSSYIKIENSDKSFTNIHNSLKRKVITIDTCHLLPSNRLWSHPRNNRRSGRDHSFYLIQFPEIFSICGHLRFLNSDALNFYCSLQSGHFLCQIKGKLKSCYIMVVIESAAGDDCGGQHKHGGRDRCRPCKIHTGI